MATDVYYEEYLFNFAKMLAKITKIGTDAMVLDVICEHLLGIPETEYAELAKEITSGREEHKYKSMMQIIGMECRKIKDEILYNKRQETHTFSEALYEKCRIFAATLHEQCGSETESLKRLPKVDLGASRNKYTQEPYFTPLELEVLEKAFHEDMREMVFRYGYAGDRTLFEKISSAYLAMRIPVSLHEQIDYRPTGKEKESWESPGALITL